MKNPTQTELGLEVLPLVWLVRPAMGQLVTEYKLSEL